MAYTKPGSTWLGRTSDIIQSSQLKIMILNFDSFILMATNVAYEADE